MGPLWILCWAWLCSRNWSAMPAAQAFSMIPSFGFGQDTELLWTLALCPAAKGGSLGLFSFYAKVLLRQRSGPVGRQLESSLFPAGALFKGCAPAPSAAGRLVGFCLLFLSFFFFPLPSLTPNISLKEWKSFQLFYIVNLSGGSTK